MSTPSVYRIEKCLNELAIAHDDALLDGDSEAEKAILGELARYLTEQHVRDPRNHSIKVNSIKLLINQVLQDADRLDEDVKQLKVRANQRRKLAQWLKDMILGTLQRVGVTRIDTPETTIAIRANGGLEPLELDEWPTYEDGTYKPVKHSLGDKYRFPVKFLAVPDTEAIREALKQRVVCPECKAAVPVDPDNPCPRCNGTGSIPNTVPGARLLERGKHLVIS